MKRGTMDVAMSRNGKRLLAVFFGLFIVFLYPLPRSFLLLFSLTIRPSSPSRCGHDDGLLRGRVAGRRDQEIADREPPGRGGDSGGGNWASSSRMPSPGGAVRFKAGISAIILLPLVVPTVVLGVSLLVLFLPQDPVIAVPLGLWAVLIGHVVIALPFYVLLLLPHIARIDKRLEEAAYGLGASGPTTFERIILPSRRR